MHSPVSPTISPDRPAPRPGHSPGHSPGRRPLRTGAAALVMLVGLAGCGYASSSGQAGAASSATAPNAAGSAGASSGAGSSAQPNPSATKTAAPGTPLNPGGTIDPPVAQAKSVPAGSKLVVFEGVSRSGNGMTLYMAATAGGGACGQYDVVVQETSSTVELGLAHLPMAKNVPCPMFVRMVQFPANLTSPVGDRQVIDMANQADIPKLPGAQNGEPSQTARAFNPVTS
jgi:hypothetical protein